MPAMSSIFSGNELMNKGKFQYTVVPLPDFSGIIVFPFSAKSSLHIPWPFRNPPG
jgi:hypothetical protein